MSNTVIKVENLSKQYRLGQVSTGTISHDVNRWWHKVRGKEDPYLKIGEANDRTTTGSSDYVWALRDINFEVKQGEVLGIIGRNGAGKSTLLKLLSRTTAPTTGSIKIKGRVASLLEVGTGFHPELSGRENIYLNGAILGMTRQEITRKFDEIVAFAGVERYIDTPVKRYSSGMYVRLAFAVAAHLEPEILIVDEVLAVGDAEFQKKCIGKMKDVSEKDGRTVLFVSHQMGTIAQLCTECILLRNGQLFASGKPEEVIDSYLLSGQNNTLFYKEDNLSKTKKIWLEQVSTMNNKGERTDQFTVDENILLECISKADVIDENVQLSVTLQDKYGYYISTSVFDYKDLPGSYNEKKFFIQMPSGIIAPNSYYFRIALFKAGGYVYDLVENICPVKVNDTGGSLAAYEGTNYGHTLMDIKIKNVI